MADRFGSLPLPVPVPSTPTDGVGDPTLVAVAAFAMAVLNAAGNDAWKALVPVASGLPEKLATHSLVFDPQDIAFNEADLPSIYAYRGPGAQSYEATDYMAEKSEVVLWWVYETAIQENQRQRYAFQNAIRKILTKAFHSGRDPAWFASDDPDTQARTLAALPTTIKTAVATSTGAQSYSGVSLNGSIGAGTVDPKRAVTVTGSGLAAAFVPGSKVTVVGESVVGVQTTWVLTLPGTVTTPFTFTTPNACQKVLSVSVEAQAAATGSWSFGTGAFAGKGTELYSYAGLMTCSVKRTGPKKLKIDMGAGEDPRFYDVVEVSLELLERLERDPSGFPAVPQTATNAEFLVPGSTFLDDAEWPDNAG